jgi:hypothetical protein
VGLPLRPTAAPRRADLLKRDGPEDSRPVNPVISAVQRAWSHLPDSGTYPRALAWRALRRARQLAAEMPLFLL